MHLASQRGETSLRARGILSSRQQGNRDVASRDSGGQGVSGLGKKRRKVDPMAGYSYPGIPALMTYERRSRGKAALSIEGFGSDEIDAKATWKKLDKGLGKIHNPRSLQPELRLKASRSNKRRASHVYNVIVYESEKGKAEWRPGPVTSIGKVDGNPAEAYLGTRGKGVEGEKAIRLRKESILFR